MIAIPDKTYTEALRMLRESTDPAALAIAKQLKLAALESAVRDLEFNDAAALCRAQAG